MTRHSIHVEEDYLAGLAKQPLNGLIELVWNSFDADADEVRVEFDRNPMEGVDAIRVIDDGHGMTHEQAVEGFTRLGGSWKRLANRSKTKNRAMHGKYGQGRFRAFGLGEQRVLWESVADGAGGRQLVSIEIRRDGLGNVEIAEPETTDRPIGTTVTLDGFGDPPKAVMTESAPRKLMATFGPQLEKYQGSLWFDGDRLDPTALQTNRAEYTLLLASATDQAELTIIEWKVDVDETLHLCDPEGITLHEVSPHVSAPRFHFTAYVRWAGFGEHVEELELADLGNPNFTEVLEVARNRIREHFEGRALERSRLVIEQWKEDQIYPYREAAKSPVEKAKRNLFDAVAVTAAQAVNAAQDRQAKRLSLQLLREATESGPTALRRVMKHVLDLPADKLAEFDALLERTSLVAIIATSKLIGDRLDFILGLEELVFAREHKTVLKERAQLHRILEHEPWVFGEQYTLAVSDQSLTKVLEAHVKALGRPELAADLRIGEVLDTEGRRRIIDLDLMYRASVPQTQNRLHHLVVELKAPKVKLNDKEIVQIEKYAQAVVADARFSKVDVEWDFYVISNELAPYAQDRASTVLPRGLIRDHDNVRIGIQTWGEVINDAKYRLNFVKEKLEYWADSDTGLDYLRTHYEAVLPTSATRPVSKAG